MPLLSDEDQQRLKSEPPVACTHCEQMVRKNYCRQCDQFFYEGHKDKCPEMDPKLAWGDNHKGHRTY